MIVLDSSGWLEYVVDGPNAEGFKPYFDNLYDIITPTIVVYEVRKVVQRDRSKKEVKLTIEYLRKTSIEILTERIAISVASLSIKHKLPMADAIIYATAQHHNVEVVTSDKHFEGLDGVVYIV